MGAVGVGASSNGVPMALPTSLTTLLLTAPPSPSPPGCAAPPVVHQPRPAHGGAGGVLRTGVSGGGGEGGGAFPGGHWRTCMHAHKGSCVSGCKGCWVPQVMCFHPVHACACAALHCPVCALKQPLPLLPSFLQDPSHLNRVLDICQELKVGGGGWHWPS